MEDTRRVSHPASASLAPQMTKRGPTLTTRSKWVGKAHVQVARRGSKVHNKPWVLSLPVRPAVVMHQNGNNNMKGNLLDSSVPGVIFY